MSCDTDIKQLTEVIESLFNHKHISNEQKKAGSLVSNAIKELLKPKPDASRVKDYIKEAEHLLPSPPEKRQHVSQQLKTPTRIPEAALDPAFRQITRPRGSISKQSSDSTKAQLLDRIEKAESELYELRTLIEESM